MELTFNQAGKFRIAQVTDIHLNHFPFDKNDQAILKDITKGIDAIQPDLIMVTGDMVNSQENEAEHLIFKGFFEFLNYFDVPKAITFGNHDSEYEMTRYDQEALFNEIVENKVHRKHEMTTHGLTQYLIEIRDQTNTITRVLYVLDSGHVPPGPGRTNDWLLPEQVQWFRQTSRHYDHLENNLVFIHIPLPEYVLAKEQIVRGELREPDQLISASNINTGLFSELFFSKQIYGVFCGHNHLNNAEMMWEGIHLFYGLFSGKEEKAGDFRGIRYIDLIDDGNQVESESVFYKDLD